MTHARLATILGALALATSLLEGQAQPAESGKKPRRPRVVTNLSGFETLDTSKGKRAAMVAGATRGGRPPVVLAPLLGKSFDTNPVFRWRPDGKADRFVFTLWNDAQDEIHRAEVTGTAYAYPASAPALESGKAYSWAVEVSAELMGGTQSAPAGVLFVSTSTREAIRRDLAAIVDPDPYASALARARAFTRHRVWYDAISAYTELIARYPRSAELFEERGMIYAQLGVTRALADEDFVRAEELPNRGVRDQRAPPPMGAGAVSSTSR